MKFIYTLLILCGLTFQLLSQEHKTSEWSYSGENGPEHWSELDEHYASCGCGVAQSPVDIEHNILEAKPMELAFEYNMAEIDFINNGHTVKEIIHEPNFVTFNGGHYKLEQFHFHTPSEHEIDHKKFPMEIHFVHKNEKNELLVVGVLVEEAKVIHPAIAILQHYMPLHKNEEVIEHSMMDLNMFLPRSKEFFHYGGSLTTPPCTEGVKWVIMEEPIWATHNQIEKIHEIIKDDNRPIQQLKGRHVYISHK